MTNGRAPHSKWRNYDDFNEYFWSLHCTQLSWPWRTSSEFFLKPEAKSKVEESGREKLPLLSIVHSWHLYHSFHRLWIFLFMTFQAMTIIGFNDGVLIQQLLNKFLVSSNVCCNELIECILDMLMMFGAYSTTHNWLFLEYLFARWFCLCISCHSISLCEEVYSRAGNYYKIYVIVIGIYAGVQFSLVS
ncbi:Callose synthase 9 [Bienertia sinuspersici]